MAMKTALGDVASTLIKENFSRMVNLAGNSVGVDLSFMKGISYDQLAYMAQSAAFTAGMARSYLNDLKQKRQRLAEEKRARESKLPEAPLYEEPKGGGGRPEEMPGREKAEEKRARESKLPEAPLYEEPKGGGGMPEMPGREKKEEAQEEARLAEIQQKLKTAAKLKTAGQAQKSAGEIMQVSASYVINAGRFLINSGLSAGATIVGIILTVILVPMGALLLGLGVSVRAAGTAAKTTGQVTIQAGQKKEIEAKKLAGQTAVERIGRAAGGDFNPLSFLQNLIPLEGWLGDFFKTLLPADLKELFYTCGTCLIGLIIGLILLVVILAGLSKYICEATWFDWCQTLKSIIDLFT